MADAPNTDWLQRYRSGSPMASWIFGAVLLGVLVWAFLFVPNPTGAQCGMLRFFISLAGGLFAFFFVGGVVLQGKLAGFLTGAAGGFALFLLLQFVFDPFQGLCTGGGKDAELKEWRGGQRLGSLVETLNNRYADGSVREQILIEHGYEDRVGNFRPAVERVTATTWVGVFQRLCDTHRCLVCEAAGKEHLRLRTTDEIQRQCADAACTQYVYICAP